MDIIEKKITQFKGKTFSNSEDALDYWRKALKEVQEATIKAMLVEEREILRQKLKEFNVAPSDLNEKLVLNREQFINQCCQEQRKRAEEILKKYVK